MKTIIVVLVVGVVTFGGYKLANKNKQVTEVRTEEQQTPKETQAPTAKKMAFSEFAKQNGSYQCTFSQISDFNSSGTVYMSGGKMRGEFKTIAEGREVSSSALIRDGYIYTWSSAAPKFGAKMAVKTEGQVNTSGVYSWDTTQVGDYDCDPWTPDEATFVVPTSVTFTLVKS